MNEIEKFLGRTDDTVAEAMRRIDRNETGILFFTDEAGRLTGCLTDGDIRRFLLSGGKLEEAAMRAANPHPRAAGNDEEARALYHKKNYIVIPIVDAEGVVVGLYNGEEIDRAPRTALKMPVVINAGGKGTRLDPFTRVLPKPLIPVGEMPIIEHIMREYQTYACDEFHVIVNYRRELMKAYFAENEHHYRITWYDEEEPLGTGGGLTLLRGKLQGTFFFANCDALLTANYERMVQFHRENGNLITMVCAYRNLTLPYGVVEMGSNGRIERMTEKPTMSFLTNTGIYLVEPEVMEDMEDGVPIGFPDVVEMERKKGRRVAVFPVSENDWMDMGQLPELEKMRKKLYGEAL